MEKETSKPNQNDKFLPLQYTETICNHSRPNSNNFQRITHHSTKITKENNTFYSNHFKFQYQETSWAMDCWPGFVVWSPDASEGPFRLYLDPGAHHETSSSSSQQNLVVFSLWDRTSQQKKQAKLYIQRKNIHTIWNTSFFFIFHLYIEILSSIMS